MRASRDAVADLSAALPAGRVVTDPDVLAAHARDEADLCAAGVPLALVTPRSTAEVAAAVRVAAAHRVPVVPQGARTGLAGGANAVDGCVLLSLEAMDRVLSVDPGERLAVVQPGVRTVDVAKAAAAAGLAYPPDPGSYESSTIGGNVATNAGGMCCVKYGVTTEYVLGLEVVLADGAVLRCGRRTVKGVAGYDLTSLFTGSEGTLGVITEITLRLRPPPAAGRSMVALFESVGEAAGAVAAITAAGRTPSMLEFLDTTVLRAIEAYRPMGLDTHAGAMLFAATDTGEAGEADLAELAGLCRTAGAGEVHVATDDTEAAALLAARRLAHVAMENLAAATFPGGRPGVVVDDVAVPRSALADLVTGVAELAEAHGVVVGVVGHAGDGNVHPVLLVDRADEDNVRRVRMVFDAIMELGLALGGTCTGEHGVGLLKREWLDRELGPVGRRVHAAVKHALDPDGILNPGKSIPGEGRLGG